jgi:phosphoserine phosphatase
MTRERLYIIHGLGNDAVGLVGRITTPIAQAGGNILDLRQDVLHGLFTLYMVVDLSGCSLRIEGLKTMVQQLSEDTGLQLAVDKYFPVARNPEKRNILVILIGKDQPGIIASVSETLGKYKSNIEFSQTVAREGIFLMELLTDISDCPIPLDNLQSVLDQHMSALGMKTVFQTEDVFNKRKRIILFDLAGSFLDQAAREEIIVQTALRPEEVRAAYPAGDVSVCLRRAAGCLAGFPAPVMTQLVSEIRATPGTLELLQTLKIMGYRIALATHGFSPFSESLPGKLGLDHCFGMPLPVDDDTRAITGEVPAEAFQQRERQNILAQLIEREAVSDQDITVVSDENDAEPPGIRLQFNLEMLLQFYNQRILTKENLLGLLGSFGLPKT